MDSTRMKMGIIGAGMISAWRHGPAIRDHERLEMSAVCRRNPKRLGMIKDTLGAAEAYTDRKEMIHECDLDAVVVSTPHHLHAAPTIAALERGLHVLVEKPLAIHGDDARAMVAAATKANRVLMVVYNDRFAGPWRTAKEALQSDAIGQIRQVSVQISVCRRSFWEEKAMPESWREMLQKLTSMPADFFQWDLSGDWRSNVEQTGGGSMANAGAHGLNLSLWLAGSQPAEIAAFAAPENSPVEYFMCIASRLANNVQFSATFADVVNGENQLRIMVVGDNGVLTYDKADEVIRITRDDGATELTSEYEDVSAIDAFLATIRNGAPNLSPAEDAANAVYLTEGSYHAAATHNLWRA
jgi:predicted dehydrogenase